MKQSVADQIENVPLGQLSVIPAVAVIGR